MSFKPEIDPKSGKIGEPIALRGEPEFLAADAAGMVYINLMDTPTRARRLYAPGSSRLWSGCVRKDRPVSQHDTRCGCYRQ